MCRRFSLALEFCGTRRAHAMLGVLMVLFCYAAATSMANEWELATSAAPSFSFVTPASAAPLRYPKKCRLVADVVPGCVTTVTPSGKRLCNDERCAPLVGVDDQLCLADRVACDKDLPPEAR